MPLQLPLGTMADWFFKKKYSKLSQILCIQNWPTERPTYQAIKDEHCGFIELVHVFHGTDL